MPLLTDDLAFIHCPKTGGTWVGQVLKAQAHVKVGASHEPWHAHAEAIGDRLLMGTMRHPLTWYPSLYIHCVGAYRKGGRYLRWWTGTDRAWEREPTAAGFRAWLEAVTHLDPKRQQPERRWDGLTQVEEGTTLLPGAEGEGLASWRHAYTYGDGEGVNSRLQFTIRTHESCRDLASILGTSRDYLRDTYPRINTAAQRRRFPLPGHVAEWYDSEMVGWVAEADAWLIEQLGGYWPEWAKPAPMLEVVI